MKILYVSQYFPPEMGAPSARVHELSREWVRRGHQVTVLTGFPNHPTGVIPPEYRGQWVRREVVDGVQVVRTPIYAAANKGLVKRSLNYLSFSVSASVVGPFLTERPDVIIATSPQFLTGVAGLWLSALKRAPFVFEVRDLWPASIVAVGAMKASHPVVKVLERLERLLYRRADHIVVVAEPYVDPIVACGTPREKISVITNGVDLDLFTPRPRDEARRRLGLDGELLVTYVGTHGMAHGLGTVLDTARLMRDRRVRFLLVGEGAEKAALRERAAREGIANVSFWDQQPRSRVVDVMAASDLCLVMLRDRPLFQGVIPSKIFEFMGAGRPIVTTVDGEARRLVERAGAGVFSPPEDARALADTVQALAADPDRRDALGRAGRSYVAQNFARPVLAERYLERLAQLARRPGGGGG